MKPTDLSPKSLNHTELRGLAFEWARTGHGYVELADYDDHYLLSYLGEIAEVERREGLFAAASVAVTRSDDFPIFGSVDVMTNCMFGCQVASYMLRQASGIPRPELTSDLDLIRRIAEVVGGSDHVDDKRSSVERLLREAVICLRPSDPEHPGLGLRVDVAASVTLAPDPIRAANLVTRFHVELRALGCQATGPNDHNVSHDLAASCGDTTAYDFLAALAAWPTWRGGSQVERAHLAGKPVLALAPEGADLSCQFQDESKGITVVARYRDDEDGLRDALIQGLAQLGPVLAARESLAASRSERYRPTFGETRDAVRELSTVELAALLPAHLTAALVHRVVGSFAAWTTAPLAIQDEIRIAIGLPPTGDRGDEWVDLLNIEHRMTLDAFRVSHNLDQRTTSSLARLMLTEIYEHSLQPAEARHREPTFTNTPDLVPLLAKLRGS